MKSRVLFITVRSDIGGGPKHVWDLATEYQTQENLQLFIAAPQGHFFPKYQKLAKEIVEIPFRNFSLTSLWQLVDIIRTNKITVVHSHGRGAGYYSRLLKLLAKVKVIHTFHGIHMEKNFKGKIKLFMDRILTPFADRYICVSHDESKSAVCAKVAKSNRICVIRNGVNLKTFGLIQNKFPGKKTFGTLCRFNYQKGLDLAVSFIARNQQQLRSLNVSFIFQGDGEEFPAIQAFINANGLQDLIQTPGPTHDPISFFEKIDYYLSFSRWEGLPLSVLEAMAANRPCLISNVVGHQTFIESQSALGFPLDSDECILKGITTFLNSTSEVDHVKEHAKNLLEDELNTKVMAEKTLSVYLGTNTIL